MLPFIELRGAVPVGATMGIPFYLNFIVSVVGNLLPVPFILIFIPKILDFMARFKIFRPIVDWVRAKAEKNRHKIIRESVSQSGENKISMSRAVFCGLLLFVAIPLPGTGAWTGSLVASLFGLPKRSSFIAITCGVIISGVIMCLASYGVVGFLSIFV